MSLLNKMLADLDARAPPGKAAPAAAVSTTPHVVKARAKFRIVTGKSPGPSQRLSILGAVSVLVLTIVAGIYLPERLRTHASSESAGPAAPETVLEKADNRDNALDAEAKAPEDEPPIDFNAETELGDEALTSEIEAEKARVLFLAQAAISDAKTTPKLPESGSDPQFPTTDVDVRRDAPLVDARRGKKDSEKVAGHPPASPAKKAPRASAPGPSSAEIKSKVGKGGNAASSPAVPKHSNTTSPSSMPIKLPVVSNQALTESDDLNAAADEFDAASLAHPSTESEVEEIVAIAAVVPPGSQAASDEVRSRAPVANDATGAGKTKAEPQRATAPATAATRYDAQYTEALAFLDAGRVSEAEHALRQVLAQRPSHTDARTALARLLLTHDRRFDAQIVLEDARSILGTTEKLLLARIYLEQGQAAQAVGLLEAVDGERSGELYAALGSAYQRLSQFARAVQMYQRAVLIEPQEGRWWLGLAIAFESEGNVTAAEQAYVRATTSEALPLALVNYAQQRLSAIQRR